MEQEKKHSIFENIVFLLGMVYKHYKIVFLFILLEMVCNGLLPLFGIYLPKLAVQLVMDNVGLSQALWALGTFALVYIIVQCVNSMAAYGKYPFQNNLRMIFTRLLFYKVLDCDYSIMETKEGRTRYEKAWSTLTNGDGSATSVMLNSVVSLTSSTITFVFIFGIISRLNLYIVSLLIVLTTLNYFLTVQHTVLKIKNGMQTVICKKNHLTLKAPCQTPPVQKIYAYTTYLCYL